MNIYRLFDKFMCDDWWVVRHWLRSASLCLPACLAAWGLALSGWLAQAFMHRHLCAMNLPSDYSPIVRYIFVLVRFYRFSSLSSSLFLTLSSLLLRFLATLACYVRYILDKAIKCVSLCRSVIYGHVLTVYVRGVTFDKGSRSVSNLFHFGVGVVVVIHCRRWRGGSIATH